MLQAAATSCGRLLSAAEHMESRNGMEAAETLEHDVLTSVTPDWVSHHVRNCPKLSTSPFDLAECNCTVRFYRSRGGKQQGVQKT